MLKFPETDDPLVAALQRLILRLGSYAALADRIDVNEQSLYQIATLKCHSTTGRVKSVGPRIRKKLDVAFPGWLDPLGHDLSDTPQLEVSRSQSWPMQRFPAAYWEQLTVDERGVVEEAMFDAYDRLMARRQQLRDERGGLRKALKPAA